MIPKFVKSVLVGLAAAVLVSAVLLTVLSFAALGMKDPGKFIGAAAYLALFGGCAAGGFLSARLNGGQGLFAGGGCGVLFVLLLILLSALTDGIRVPWLPFAAAAASALAGLAGREREPSPAKEKKRKKKRRIAAARGIRGSGLPAAGRHP